MKIRLKVNKRYQFMVLLSACGASLWMMVVRFGYPVEKLIQGFWIIVVLLGAIVVVALPVAVFLRWLKGRKEDIDFSAQNTKSKD